MSERRETRASASEAEADKAASELRDQMTRLKARYRVERRMLESRSFDPKEKG